MIAFDIASTAVSGSGVSTITIDLGVTGGRQLAIVELAIENVPANSGPWVVPDNTPGHAGPGNGWERVLYRGPSANGGNGIEIWAAILNNASGPPIFNVTFTLASSLTLIIGASIYTGTLDPTGPSGQSAPVSDGVIRASLNRQVTGNNPAAPGIYAYKNELVVVAASTQLQSPGYGAPAGFNERCDVARSSTYGNVEYTFGDALITTEGPTGDIPWTATAATGTTKGATATLAVRPAATPAPATSPAIHVEYAVPVS